MSATRTTKKNALPNVWAKEFGLELGKKAFSWEVSLNRLICAPGGSARLESSRAWPRLTCPTARGVRWRPCDLWSVRVVRLPCAGESHATSAQRVGTFAAAAKATPLSRRKWYTGARLLRAPVLERSLDWPMRLELGAPTSSTRAAIVGAQQVISPTRSLCRRRRRSGYLPAGRLRVKVAARTTD